MARPPLASISSVKEFIETISALTRTSGFFFTYRGQRNAIWKATPGILRDNFKKFLQHERDAIRDLQSIHPQEFHSDATMFDRLVRMQHFGLPTRLLDVTSNPLVALYFATEPYRSTSVEISGRVFVYTVPHVRKKYFDSDAISCVANIANLSSVEKTEIEESNEGDLTSFNQLPPISRLVQFVRSEKPYFGSNIIRDDLVRANYVVPKMSNRRIIAQSGSFIIFGLSANDRIATSTRPIIRSDGILVSQRAKAPIRTELDNLGINESTLFPEIDRAASYIVRRYNK